MHESTVFSKSTHDFPNRLGRDTNVYLGSAEPAAVTTRLGRMPTTQEYRHTTAMIERHRNAICQCLQFDRSEAYGGQEMASSRRR